MSGRKIIEGLKEAVAHARGEAKENEADRERAHRLMIRCSGGKGHGPGGDGPRWHSVACDRLTREFAEVREEGRAEFRGLYLAALKRLPPV